MTVKDLHAKLTDILDKNPELEKQLVGLYEDAENEGLQIDVPGARAPWENIIITF